MGVLGSGYVDLAGAIVNLNKFLAVTNFSIVESD